MRHRIFVARKPFTSAPPLPDREGLTGWFPLSVAVAQLKGVYYQDYGLQIAGTLLAVAPVLGLFLFLQRDFVSGLTSGAVKE